MQWCMVNKAEIKGTFIYSYSTNADSQNWVKSEIVCRCTDEEFQQLLKGLSYIVSTLTNWLASKFFFQYWYILQ